jgi:hypothetical protein
MQIAERATLETAAGDARLVGAAIRSFFNLVNVWDLDALTQRRLLGGIGHGTLYNWRANPPSSVSSDVMERLSYLLAIHALLRQLFPEAHLAQMRERVRRVPPTPLTAGKSILEFLLEGGIVAMHELRSYLVSEAGADITAPEDLPVFAPATPTRW